MHRLRVAIAVRDRSDAHHPGQRSERKPGACWPLSGSITVTNASDAGGVYGSQIVTGDAVFPFTGTGPSSDGTYVCLGVTGPSQWCGTIVNEPNNDGETIIVVGDARSGFPISAPPSSGTNNLYWGAALLRPNDATACSGSPRSIEIPATGSGVDSTTGQTPSFEGTISVVQTPLNATLSGAVSVNVGSVDGQVIIGCDDFPALTAATNYFQRPPRPGQEQPQELYFPGNSFMASGTFAAEAQWTVARFCGEGTVFWPFSMHFDHGAAACNSTARAHPGFANDLVPAIHLKHLTTLTAGSTATLVTVGNSAITPGENQANALSSWHDTICAAFEHAYPDLVWKCIALGIGGTQWQDIDPGGWSNGIPQATTSAASWYTDLTKKWLDYAEGYDPDVMVFQFTNVGAQSIYLSSIIGAVNYTQTGTWSGIAGWNPDIIFGTDAWQPGDTRRMAQHDFAASIIRSYAKACQTRLTNGGCIGLLDSARMGHVMLDGWDPEAMPLRRTTAVPTYQGSRVTTFPWNYTTPRRALSGAIFPFWSNASAGASAFFSQIGGEFDFYISAGGLDTASVSPLSAATTASAASGQAVIQMGYSAYELKTGYTVTGSSKIPANTTIQSISLSSATSTITLTNNITTSTLASGTSLNFQPGGPTTGYPGGILRISRDSGTGNIAYKYDTVYFQTAGSDCSGSISTPTLTCTTAEVGLWHNNMSVSVPTGNTGGSTPLVTTISAISGDGKTITLATNLLHAVSNQQLTVYRTQIPLTVSGRSADALTGNCFLNAGANITLYFQIEFRGSRAMVSYCDPVSQGVIPFEFTVERFESPFLFAIDTPNHMSGASVRFYGGGVSGNSTGARSYWFEGAPEYPTFEPSLRMVPDVYGQCSPTYPYGEYALWGGECDNHRGFSGTSAIDNAVIDAIRLR